MKCHYEVLGVDSNCSPDDLKKAYRKLALEWHPDKNLDRLEEAKETFQLIQQAYEILIDPQERAWYDRHRDDILRGASEENYKDDCLDVYQYFNTSCFKGYNDDEKGFYTVYRQVFEKITAEDKPFMDEEDNIKVPQFGYSYSSYDEVVHSFYAYWQSYCTSKSYSWIDKFDLTEARKSGVGRQIIRAMEKENKKLRDLHKKMRNEEVRELIAFVRKRDKRVQAHKKLMEEIKAEKAKKAEEMRRKQLKERNKILEDYKESEWSSMSQFEQHFNEIETTLNNTFGSDTTDKNDEEEDDLEECEDLYCVACEKDFRSQMALKNHENSKKHKENVAVLKALMEEEEELAAENGFVDDKNDEEEAENSISEDIISSEALLDELIKSSTKTKKKKKKGKTCVPDPEEKVQSEATVDKCLKIDDLQISADVNTNKNLPSTSAKPPTKSDTKRKGKKDKGAKDVGNVPNGEEDKHEKIQNEDIVGETLKSDNHKISTDVDTEENLQCIIVKQSTKSNTKKKGKKDNIVKDVVNLPNSEEDNTEKPSTVCGTCNTNFSSRNKLFDHLKQSGHAVYKNENSSGQNASSASSKKQRRKKL